MLFICNTDSDKRQSYYLVLIGLDKRTTKTLGEFSLMLEGLIGSFTIGVEVTGADV